MKFTGKKGIGAFERIAAAICALSLCIPFASPALAQVMSSSNYRMQSDSVNVGGALSSSGSYLIEDTAGEAGTGLSASAGYNLSAGYQQASTASAPDTTAPSVPAGLSAVGLSTSSVRLTWTASIDDVAVAGYRVYRDGAFVATSTGTTYDDTGLSAATSYVYNVDAFDYSTNVSAKSASTTGTTLSAAVPTTPSPSTGGGSGVPVPLNIYDVTMSAGQNVIYMTWKTLPAAISKISWGETRSYELGSIDEGAYSLTHSLSIGSLRSGTRYFLRIEAVDEYGRKSVVDGIEVRTMRSETVTAPENVAGFTATAGSEDIALSWRNPKSAEFKDVVIVRSDSFFPTNADDGKVVYEGPSQSYKDKDVAAGKMYYYAAFARTADGRYSSGAVASARIGATGPENPLGNLPEAPDVHPKIKDLTLADFSFVQGGRSMPMLDGEKVLINGGKELVISLDYSRVPEVLKTIAVTLSHPDDPTQVFSFLLKVNKEKTAYEAVIAPLENAGDYGIAIAVVDHKNRGMKKVEGKLYAAVAHAISVATVDMNNVMMYLALLALVLVFTAWVMVALVRKMYRELKGDKSYGA